MPSTSINIRFKDSDFSNISDIAALRTFVKDNIWTECDMDDESTWTAPFLVDFSNSYFNDKVFRTGGALNSDLVSAIDAATQVSTGEIYHTLYIPNTTITV